MVHNTVPTQLNTKYNSYVSTNILSFMHSQNAQPSLPNHLHHTICILQYFNNNNKTLQQATKRNVK